MIDIEIDGVKLTVPQNTMIIEAADKAGINIPRFCYHKKLTIAANCRMCLIEVEKVGKPLPACATPVAQGMRVFTHSPRALEAQRAVMEFLLINHPLDCPICDQGGECELQDVSMGYGSDYSRFSEGKRAVFDEDLGPLIASDMTRCIQCTRCVRFGQEIAGVRELGATGRGEHMEIGTYVKHTLSSELSGNIIDLCPVGALTSKPFRFQARAWELTQSPSIAAHDAVGSHIYIQVHSRLGKVMRVVPRDEEEINETWISDRDRFSYLGIESPARLRAPMIKAHGEWYETDWASALEAVVSRLSEVISNHGADQIAALGSPSLTLEEAYLLQKFWRAIGSPHLDHRLHQIDFTDQNSASLYPGLNGNIAELEKKDTILLIGSDIHHEQPLIAQRLRKASLQGAKVITINPMDFALNFPVVRKIVSHPYQMIDQLAGIMKALHKEPTTLPVEFTQRFEQVVCETVHSEIANYLKEGSAVCVLLGAAALNHPQASMIRWLAQYMSETIGALFGELAEGANAAGAWLTGLLPHRMAAGKQLEKPGLDAQKMFASSLKGYLLVGLEPAFDLANAHRAIDRLKQAEFVVAISSFKTKDLLNTAEILLPATTFGETSGTFVNTEGRWQSFKGSVSPVREARPLWKILRVLSNLFKLEGFNYETSEQVRDELQDLIVNTSVWERVQSSFPVQHKMDRSPLTRIGAWPIYRTDPLVRHAEALQKLPTQRKVGVYINANMAKKLGFSDNQLVKVTQGAVEAQLTLYVDAAVPDACVFIPCGYAETAMFGLGEDFQKINIS